MLIAFLFQGCPDTDVGPHELVPCATLLIMRATGESAQDLDRSPSPVGGIASMTSYSYPEIARRASVEGWVTVHFVVDELGEAHGAQVVKGIGAGCDEEAIKLIRNTTYDPATRNGTATWVSAEAVVRFDLECVAE